MGHSYTPGYPGGLRQEDHNFKICLGYIRNKKPDQTICLKNSKKRRDRRYRSEPLPSVCKALGSILGTQGRIYGSVAKVLELPSQKA